MDLPTGVPLESYVEEASVTLNALACYSERSVPNLAVVGAMKAGTTTLAGLLRRHPRIALSSRKEPGFFSRDERYASGFEWYRNLFEDAVPGQLWCDASTCYSRSRVYPKAAQRLAAASPEVKLIYVLRHPVDRAYSHYCHIVRERFLQGKRAPSLRAVLDEDPECVSASEYSRELRHLWEYFPRENTLCLRFEDVTRDLSATAYKITAFLGIEPFLPETLHSVDAENVKGQNIQQHEANRAASRLRKSLPARMLKPLLNQRQRAGLVQITARQLERLGWGNTTREAYLSVLDPLDSATRLELHRRLDRDTLELGEIIGWDVSSWVQCKSVGDVTGPLQRELGSET